MKRNGRKIRYRDCVSEMTATYFSGISLLTKFKLKAKNIMLRYARHDAAEHILGNCTALL